MARFTRAGLVVGGVLLAAVGSAGAAPPAKGVDEVTVKKITEAMPAEAPAKPAKTRQVLVYSHCNGFYHGSIPTGNKAMEIMGEKTKAFTAVVSDDLSNFQPDKLKAFDAVVLNNCTGELFAPQKKSAPEEAQAAKALRQNLLDWVKAGGGIVGIHAATDTSNCDEYNEVIGGRFSGHPWHTLVPIKNDDPANPINAAFDGKGFEVTDEIYQFNKGHYSRYKQRVLLSLDRAKMEASEKTKKDGSRKDKDYAISWVKTHGQGRVFYCSLGHRNEIFWNPAVLKHYLAGLQWAMGDLKGVETAPNPLPESEKPPK